MWPAMARMHNPRVGECLISKRATKSATAASASAVTDRPSRTRFRRARIKCVRLAMLSSRTKPSTVAGVLGSCLVTKVRYLLARVMISAGSTETSGHCARIAEGKPSVSLTVMRGLRGCASDCCPCSIVGHAPRASPATGPPDTGAGSHTETAWSARPPFDSWAAGSLTRAKALTVALAPPSATGPLGMLQTASARLFGRLDRNLRSPSLALRIWMSLLGTVPITSAMRPRGRSCPWRSRDTEEPFLLTLRLDGLGRARKIAVTFLCSAIRKSEAMWSCPS